jgi:hypothetical protein
MDKTKRSNSCLQLILALFLSFSLPIGGIAAQQNNLQKLNIVIIWPGI